MTVPAAFATPAASRTRVLAAGAAAATGVLVGSALVATRAVVDQAGPATLALLRYLIGVLCLLPAALVAARGVHIERRDLGPIALLGIIQFGILIALLNYALRFIPSAHAALLFATMPLMTMVLGAALGREPLTASKTAGVLLTIVGVACTLGEVAIRPGAAPHAVAGQLAALASALCGAVCSVLYRPYLAKYPTLPVSAFAMLAAVAFLALLACGEGVFRAPPHFTGEGWLAVAFIGANSGIGYFLWLWALGHAEPTRVTAFLALSPITAAALGAWLLREALSTLVLAGLACVVAGLWIAHRRPEARAGPGGVVS